MAAELEAAGRVTSAETRYGPAAMARMMGRARDTAHVSRARDGNFAALQGIARNALKVKFGIDVR
jgi:hypothetical protein